MKSTSLALLSLAALPLALGAYVHGRSDEAAPPTVTVTAHDYQLEMPDTLPGRCHHAPVGQSRARSSTTSGSPGWMAARR